MNDLKLRPSTAEDIAIFFEYQLDEEANHMAAFTAKDPTDKQAMTWVLNEPVKLEINIETNQSKIA